ncbi:helix-turn-helix domain-containing protein [Tahibacter soli]|uniref:Helix-turn-helix domain-containing protein n=1 Tax=Tahibacter soli TaxID=2983605 RepID=A0A9X4BL31_9GAMM|nr:helix-turn-helix domain-containing protein [Tahibacter soli]MDC8013799.1 helix-turn-helix domain-containing protein [Tahibacter soli]
MTSIFSGPDAGASRDRGFAAPVLPVPMSSVSWSMHTASAVAERLFDCAQDTLFFVKNRDARYVAVNRTLVERCGARAKSDLIGRTARDLFPSAFGAACYAQDLAVLDDGVELHDRLQQLPHADGGASWCVSYKFPLLEEGRVVGLCGICKLIAAVDAGADGYANVARALDFIRQHYAEPIRIDALARVAGLGTRRLERLLKRLFDRTPMQLVANTRAEAAARLLVRRDVGLAQVAAVCGYSDQSAFTRQFKAVTGATPAAYRASRIATAAARERG